LLKSIFFVLTRTSFDLTNAVSAKTRSRHVCRIARRLDSRFVRKPLQCLTAY